MLAYGHIAFFIAFSQYGYISFFQMQRATLQTEHFTETQTAIQHQKTYAEIAITQSCVRMLTENQKQPFHLIIRKHIKDFATRFRKSERRNKIIPKIPFTICPR